MKRLFTIFLISIMGIELWGQTKLPMTVVGDVYVAGNGIIKSNGAVHLKALDWDKVAKVANYGTLDMDSIIFYSNDLIDGLLMNQNINPISGAPTPQAKVTTTEVTVRKNFGIEKYWYSMSFPFNVDLNNGVINPLTGMKLVRGTDFEVQSYHPEIRADRGVNDSNNWEILPSDSVTLRKGVAYRVSVMFSRLENPVSKSNYDLDFVANTVGDNENIPYVFEPETKGLDLRFDPSPAGKFIDNNSEGWNAFGGLNSTNFLFSSSTIFYNPSPTSTNRVIYYWDKWKGIWDVLDLDLMTGTLRPYTIIFVKTNNQTVLTRQAGGGFAYLNGITLDTIASAPVFRSIQATMDILGVNLTDAKDDAKSSNIYFKFGDGFSKLYNSTEDAIRLDVKSTNVPILWSVAQNENNTNIVLFIDCLPYEKNEIPLGVNIPAAGEYVFSLSNITSETMKSAVLWDKVTNVKTDLFRNEYRFQSDGASNSEDRFVIIFDQTVTSIAPLNSLEIYAYTDNNILTVKNLIPGDKVQVLDMTGRMIVSGIASNDTFSTPLNQKGVFIVNVRGKALKVLNK